MLLLFSFFSVAMWSSCLSPQLTSLCNAACKCNYVIYIQRKLHLQVLIINLTYYNKCSWCDGLLFVFQNAVSFSSQEACSSCIKTDSSESLTVRKLKPLLQPSFSSCGRLILLSFTFFSEHTASIAGVQPFVFFRRPC